MITVVLAVATAGLFGVGDFLGGLASRRESAFAVTTAAHAVGVVAFTALVLIFPAPVTARDIASGALAGVAGGIGVASLYGALGRGRMSVVAPLTAALSGSLPALYDFARGETLPPSSIAGLVLALAATVIVSATSSPDGHGADDPGMPPAAVGLSLVAGVGFAGSFIAFSFSDAGSGFWPLLAARLTSVTLIGAATLVTQRTLRVVAPARRATLGAGVFDTTANITMLTAIRIGPLAVASVLGSLYPVATVLLARAVLGEHLRGLQRAGVALAFAAVVLAAWR